MDASPAFRAAVFADSERNASRARPGSSARQNCPALPLAFVSEYSIARCADGTPGNPQEVVYGLSLTAALFRRAGRTNESLLRILREADQHLPVFGEKPAHGFESEATLVVHEPDPQLRTALNE